MAEHRARSGPPLAAGWGARIAALAVMLVLYLMAVVLGHVSFPIHRNASGVEDVGHLLVPSLVSMVGKPMAEYVFWAGTLPLELFFLAIVLVVMVRGRGLRLGIALYVAYFLHWLFLHATVLPPPDDHVWRFPEGVFTLGKPHARDFWFSGHTANAVLIALAAHRRPSWVRVLAWGNVAFQVLLVLAARTHYTIDVLGGIFVAYTIDRASREVAARAGWLGPAVIDKEAKMQSVISVAVGGVLFSAVAAGAAQPPAPATASAACRGLPAHAELKAALVAATSAETSGLNHHMWATVVNRDGVVCAVAFSGTDRWSQWPGSRVISAQKASTAASFNLDKGSFGGGSGQAAGLALSTANLYSAVQPGGSLYGLQHSNPVDTAAAYPGPAARYGMANDPLVGRRVGGVNVFGGGLGLYAAGRTMVGGLGVSGDTSCADHNIAWRVRHLLKLDHLAGVGGVSGDTTRPDNVVFDITDNAAGGTGRSAGGFGHPKCPNTSGSEALPPVQ